MYMIEMIYLAENGDVCRDISFESSNCYSRVVAGLLPNGIFRLH